VVLLPKVTHIILMPPALKDELPLQLLTQSSFKELSLLLDASKVLFVREASN
jgi:hypothetical protein